jgi:hypothetical protein
MRYVIFIFLVIVIPVYSQNNADSLQSRETTPETIESQQVLNWNKYDFIPGSEIIFEDNQEGEQNGEFPSKWDLVRGNIENAKFNGEEVIYFIKVNSNGGGGIVPLIKNNSQDYLPDEFTVEFDAYFPDNQLTYYLFFADYKNQKNIFKTGDDPSAWSGEKFIRFKQKCS